MTANEERRYRTLRAATKELRRLQRQWYGGDKSHACLIACKKAEKLVDELLSEMDQASLFEEEGEPVGGPSRREMR